METQTARDLFAEDYLLVADNDYTTNLLLTKLAKWNSVVTLSDTIREHYEELTDRVCNLMSEKEFSEFERLLMRQLLQGWGSDAFDTIARELKGRE